MIFEMGILSSRRVGFLLALFWLGMLCYIWLPDHVPDFLNLRSSSETEKGKEKNGHITLDKLFSGSKLRPIISNISSSTNSTVVHDENTIHVCITSDKKTLGGAIALINSIISNTKANVKFHVVLDESSVNHFIIWIAKSKLKDINYEVKSFPTEWVTGKIKIRGGRKELGSPLNYARFYLPRLFPDLKERVIFIDDDCIVQGDIKELNNTHLAKDHLIAFSDECKGIGKRLNRYNVYAEFLDFKNEHIKKMQMKASSCSFNTGLFVTDLAQWAKNNITEQLEYWMELNTKEEVYGNERGGGGSQPPMMIVFYNQYSSIDPIWHVRNLGLTAGTSYSKSFTKSAKLLHWNGIFKPWGRSCQHQDIWSKYFLPDPLNQFKPVRRTP